MVILLLGVGHLTMAQGFEPVKGFKQINLGVGVSSWGVPVYAGFDYGVTEKITVGGRVSYRSYDVGWFGQNFQYSIINIGFRGDYHFGAHILDFPPELDLYGGLTLGYSAWKQDFDDITGYSAESSRAYLALQAGGRWYFNEKWGANIEFAGGSFTGLEIGASYRF